MQKQFNLSLSTEKYSSYTAIVKWRLRAKGKLFLCNGGAHQFSGGDAIVIRRVDVQRVHDHARLNCTLRDYLLIRLPMKIGLRTSEIATLRIEQIDFKNRSFNVLDSKKHRLFPLPLDMVTLQMIQDLAGLEVQGYVFKHQSWQARRGDQALTRTAVWQRTRDIGLTAGVERFNPRILRHFFACDWHYVQKKSVEMLRRILRHKNLSVTHRYLARLVFFEDLQREYNQTQAPFLAEKETSPFYQENCRNCQSEPTCKYVSQVGSTPWAKGCRYYKRKEEIPKIEKVVKDK